MRVAVFQGECRPGNLERNWETMLSALKECRQKAADILCMPETFLQGYFPNVADARANSFRLDSDAFDRIVSSTRGYTPMVLVGLNERRGDELYNTVVVLQDGRYLGRYSKAYPIFDFYSPGREFEIFECAEIKFGIIICADTAYIDPARLLALKGAQVLFAPHHNYIRFDRVKEHTELVRGHLMCRAIENDVYLVRSNVIWTEQAPGFTYAGLGIGDSLVLDRRGRAVVEVGWFQSALCVVDIPENDLRSGDGRFNDPDLCDSIATHLRSKARQRR